MQRRKHASICPSCGVHTSCGSTGSKACKSVKVWYPLWALSPCRDLKRSRQYACLRMIITRLHPDLNVGCKLTEQALALADATHREVLSLRNAIGWVHN
eukprot:4971459-Amphidinium_carterae.1